jgi:farnesol dehydrogenase
VKVVVSGVTGFLGGRVASDLVRAGHKVVGFCRDESRWSGRPESATVVTGDVADRAAVERAVEGCDAMVHAAALVKTWVRDKREFDRVNVEGLGYVIGACRDAGARLVYISSFIALGPTDGTTFDEASPRADNTFHNDYERTKWLADQLARNAGTSNLDLVRVYPGVIFGPGALTAGNHVVKLLLQHARGKLPGMLGRGDLRQCFAYVEDVAQGVVQALERGTAGEGYILGGENRTGVDLFDAFEAATGVAPPTRKIPFWAASAIGKAQRWRAELLNIEPELTDEVVGIYRHEWAYRSDKAVAELGYRVTPFVEAVAKTVAWLRESGELT